MKLFTRLFLVLMVAIIPLAKVVAGTTVTIMVGDNWYVTQAGTHTTTINSDDILIFQFVGHSSHPTMSDSSPAAWPIFQMNSANTTMTFPANTFVAGTYPYHCTAHSFLVNGVWQGQPGTLIVQRPLATEDARPTLALNLFPNPSKGLVTLQLTQKPGQDCKLRLNNVIGQEVRTFALKPELTEAGLALDLRDLPSGMYFYSLIVDGKTVTSKRLVLQN